MSVLRWADHTDRADRSASVIRKIEIRGIERGEDLIWKKTNGEAYARK